MRRGSWACCAARPAINDTLGLSIKKTRLWVRSVHTQAPEQRQVIERPSLQRSLTKFAGRNGDKGAGWREGEQREAYKETIWSLRMTIG